ncbi:MAG: DUF1730 domain-containing protein, partial [Firmicutes bacterium]|nr:DUF1730 domain-containing protein [Bacillota bacterium]
MSLERDVKAEARRLGLDLVGIASAAPFLQEKALLRERESLGYRSPLEERDVALRTDPARLLPGVRSIIAVGLNYYQLAEASGDGALRGWLSRYT